MTVPIYICDPKTKFIIPENIADLDMLICDTSADVTNLLNEWQSQVSEATAVPITLKIYKHIGKSVRNQHLYYAFSHLLQDAKTIKNIGMRNTAAALGNEMFFL